MTTRGNDNWLSQFHRPKDGVLSLWCRDQRWENIIKLTRRPPRPDTWAGNFLEELPKLHRCAAPQICNEDQNWHTICQHVKYLNWQKLSKHWLNKKTYLRPAHILVPCPNGVSKNGCTFDAANECNSNSVEYFFVSERSNDSLATTFASTVSIISNHWKT